MLKEFDSVDSWPWPDADVSDALVRALSLFAPPSKDYQRARAVVNEWLSALAVPTVGGPRCRDLCAYLSGMDDVDLLREVLGRWLDAVTVLSRREARYAVRGMWGWQSAVDLPARERHVPVPRVDLAAVSRARRMALTGEARAVRLAACITLTEAASVLGVSAGTLSRWETGKSSPRPAEAARWAALLDSLADGAVEPDSDADAA